MIFLTYRLDILPQSSELKERRGNIFCNNSGLENKAFRSIAGLILSGKSTLFGGLLILAL